MSLEHPVYPSDFDHTKVSRYIKEFEKHGLIRGRLISGSKSAYSKTYPKHLIVYNANAIIKSVGKIWYGDLDLTYDYKILKQIADKLGEPIYIVWEQYARFGAENKPIDEILRHTVWSTEDEWVPTLKNYKKYKMGKTE